AGSHNLRLEYYEGAGLARANLSWAPLLPPSNLRACGVSASEITLCWGDSNFQDGYKIERWNGSSYAQIATVGANMTSYTNTGLTPLTTYSYRVKAYNSAGDSAPSNEVSATTICTYVVSPTSFNLDKNSYN